MTNTEPLPAGNPLTICVLPPFDHSNVYGYDPFKFVTLPYPPLIMLQGLAPVISTSKSNVFEELNVTVDVVYSWRLPSTTTA